VVWVRPVTADVVISGINWLSGMRIHEATAVVGNLNPFHVCRRNVPGCEKQNGECGDDAHGGRLSGRFIHGCCEGRAMHIAEARRWDQFLSSGLPCQSLASVRLPRRKRDAATARRFLQR